MPKGSGTCFPLSQECGISGLETWSVGFDPDIRADVFCTDDQNWQLPPAGAQV